MNTVPTVAAATELFKYPNVHKSVLFGHHVIYRPISNIDSHESPIEFNIPATAEYIDFQNSRLRLKVIIQLEDGTNLPTGCKIAPVNNFMHSLFSTINLELGSTCITQSSGLYNYRAYIEKLLNYQTESLKSHVRSSFFEKDKGDMLASEANTGYVKRRLWSSKGEFDMEGILHCDFFLQNKFLLSNTPVNLKLHRSKPEFCLISDKTDTNKYRIKITEAAFVVRRVKLADAVVIAHESALLKETAKYFLTRVECRSYSISSNLITTSFDNLFLGQLPKRIVLGFVDQQNFNGTLSSNPLSFDHFNFRFIDVKSDSSLNILPVEANFENGTYLQAYNSLFYQTGINYSDCGLSVTHSDYINGYCLVVFDLTQDISASSNHWTPQTTGIISLTINFSKTLTSPLTLIVFAEYQNTVEIDRYRKVTTDYSR